MLRALFAHLAPSGAKAVDGDWPRPSMALRTVLLAFLLVPSHGSILQARAQQLKLPVYRLTIDSQDLDALYRSPFSDIRYPAQFTFAGQTQECQVRFRGATARKYDKKSWKIWFEDRRNPLAAREINLNAEYRDLSLMRNALTMKLFQFFGHPAPETRHISLVLNDHFMGVFVQVEEMNEDFLERYDLEPGTLYKSEDHGGSTAPLLDFDNYAVSWNKKVGDESDYSDLQRLFNQLFYLTHEDLEAQILFILNAEDVLRYFAISYAISSFDSVTKNTLLYFDSRGRLDQVMPWDHDASFGNHWSGEYRSHFETTYQYFSFRYHLLFQRLMEHDTWRQSFWRMVHTVIDRGFDAVEAEIDSTYELIRSDVYLDEAKLGTNAEFDDQISLLKGFLSARRSFLADFRFFEKSPLSNLYCSTPFPSRDNDGEGVVFQATSPTSQSVVVEYVTDLTSYTTPGVEITVEKLLLFDDGNHDDLQAGDLVYGNRLVLPKGFTGLIPYAFRAGEYSYPPNGLFYINYKATKSFALNAGRVGRKEYEDLRIGEVYEMHDEHFIEIANSGEVQLDLSYCSFQSGEYFNRFMFPPGTHLAAGDSLILSSNRDLARGLFGRTPVLGDLFFEISLGDTMTLLGPSLSTLTARVNQAYSFIDLPSRRIVINEINYHSADELNTGDWVELYNPDDALADLSGWSFQDGNNRHSFVFPVATLVSPHGFLVLCQDREALESLSGVPCVGDFDFGLRNSGELIRLYDRDGLLVDSVVYGDGSPWPEEADGDGPTLELRHHGLDNSNPDHWMASLATGGTPGRINSSQNPRGAGDSVPFSLSEATPNPFFSTVGLDLHLERSVRATLKVYNALGQLEEILFDTGVPLGLTRFTWTPRERGAGIYFVALHLEGRLEAVRKAVYLGQ